LDGSICVRPAIISKLEAEALSLLICGDGSEKRLPYREAIGVMRCPNLVGWFDRSQ
jgi:hypothetical protein